MLPLAYLTLFASAPAIAALPAEPAPLRFAQAPVLRKRRHRLPNAHRLCTARLTRPG
jgi:hypothetical protein